MGPAAALPGKMSALLAEKRTPDLPGVRNGDLIFEDTRECGGLPPPFGSVRRQQAAALQVSVIIERRLVAGALRKLH